LEKVRSVRNKLLHLKEVIVFDDKDAVQMQDMGIVKKSAAEKAKEKEAEDEAAEDVGDESGMAIEEESEWALAFEDHVHYWSDIRKKYYTDDDMNKRWNKKVNGRKQVFNCTEFKTEEELLAFDMEAAERRSTCKPEDVLCMIYTSGTTGPPKAVMITHRNVGWSIYSIGDIMHVSPEDTVVSYLPLCHIAEKICSLYGPLVFGMNVYFCAPDALRGTLVITMRQVGPTVFFGVPRIWEKIQEKMIANSGKQAVYFCFCIPTGAWGKRKWKDLVTWARKKGLAGAYAYQQNEPMPKNWWYANELVFQNVKVALGLQRCRIMLSAAAPLSIETAEFFMALNILIFEAFGMSETAGPVTFNAPKTKTNKLSWRTNSCGKEITGVELKIADDGELLIRGACTCRGYFKNPEETANLIDEDKWIHTGDIGTIDADGFLYITDRKKHLIITAGGENIAPAPIEGSLSAMPGIGYAVVVGDMQKFLVCLLTIEVQNAAHFAFKNYNWVGEKSDWKGATAWLRDDSKMLLQEGYVGCDREDQRAPSSCQYHQEILFSRKGLLRPGQHVRAYAHSEGQA
jgi:long-subunit acyl-CoA synthetase (AMP-forming)